MDVCAISSRGQYDSDDVTCLDMREADPKRERKREHSNGRKSRKLLEN
jgi:hypothetical protein